MINRIIQNNHKRYAWAFMLMTGNRSSTRPRWTSQRSIKSARAMYESSAGDNPHNLKILYKMQRSIEK